MSTKIDVSAPCLVSLLGQMWKMKCRGMQIPAVHIDAGVPQDIEGRPGGSL